MATTRTVWRVSLTALFIAAVAVSSARSQSDPGRGQRIYLSGESPSGSEIIALLERGGERGGEVVEVPASALPCAGCHGRDGRGIPEGGVSPSDVTWGALTSPDGVTHESGRAHPPYTEDSLKRAIAAGTDPAGNTLQVVMPRYRMSPEDMNELVAYLKGL
jgi:hypothetical protein